jgi:hypothetical protein
MTDYNKYNTNLILKTAMQDPNMAEQVNQALGTISKPTSSVFPTGEFMGMSVSPRVQEVVNMLTQLPVGAGSAAIGATSSGKNLLGKYLKKKTKLNPLKAESADHDTMIELYRKFNREGVEGLNRIEKQYLARHMEDFEFYRDAISQEPYFYLQYPEKVRGDAWNLEQTNKLRHLYETMVEGKSGLMSKAGQTRREAERYLDKITNPIKRKRIDDGWDQYVDDDYLQGLDEGVVDYDKHLYHVAHDLPSQKSPLQKVIDADILHDAYTGGRFTPGMSSKTGSVPGGQTVKRTGVDPVQSPSGIEAEYRKLILEVRGKDGLINFDNMINSRINWIKRNWDSHKVDMRYNRGGDKSFPKVGTKRYLEIRNKLAREIGNEM